MRGSKLPEWRKRHDLSQAELAHALRVNRQTVMAWEKAENIPPLVEIALKAIDHKLLDLEPHRLPNGPGRPKRAALGAERHENSSHESLADRATASTTGLPMDRESGTDLAETRQNPEEPNRRFDDEKSLSRAKSAFLANMSHELRSPLTAILGFSEAITREMFGPVGSARYLEYAQLIHQSGLHLLNLINDVLDMSKLEAGKCELLEETFNLEEAAADCIRSVRPQAEAAGVELRSAIIPAAQVIFADKRAIKQILLNLLSNSIRFTPHGGQVFVSAGLSSMGIEIAITDTGIGISAEFIPRLGQPFVHTEGERVPTKGGAGLGLASVKNLASAHGGEMAIESTPGKGTTVRVWLPNATVERRDALVA